MLNPEVYILINLGFIYVTYCDSMSLLVFKKDKVDKYFELIYTINLPTIKFIDLQ